MAAVKILAADSVSLSGSRILSSKKFSITTHTGLTNSQILRMYPGFSVLLIRSTRKISRDFLEKCNLNLIATFTKGTDHIDLNHAKRLGIKVINADEGNHISAAEHSLALILSIFKNLILSDSLVRAKKFSDTNFRRNELYGKTIGIIGFGKVGSYVGKLCKSFGMKVMANDIDKDVVMRNPEFDFFPLGKLLAKADIISVHIPFNKRNEKFITRERFSKMKRDCIFINTSRGAVAEEEALIDMLKGGGLRYAGLDVFNDEPHIDSRFFRLKNTVLTNHIAGKTSESRDRISGIVFQKILDHYRNM